MTPSHPRLAPIAGLLTLGLIAACGGNQDDGGAAADDDAASTPDAAQSQEPEPEPFTIAFGGDVHFEPPIRQRLDADPPTAMGDVADTFAEADISMVNLETAVTEGGAPVNKAFTFRAPPSAFEALSGANVDVASVANNHGMDYGLEGLEDTLDHAESADFPLVGIGRDAEEAYAPHLIDVNNQTVALLGATDVLDAEFLSSWTATDEQPGLASTKGESLSRMLEAVSAAEEQADTVIVYLHWGLEGDHCPLPHAPDLARQLVDAGADAVVGGHAHVVGPGGYLDGAYVHYGLGNFVFYNFSGPTAETGVLQLTMLGDEVVDDEWLPGQIQGAGVPVLDQDPEAGVQRWEGYRDQCTPELSAEPS